MSGRSWNALDGGLPSTPIWLEAHRSPSSGVAWGGPVVSVELITWLALLIVGFIILLMSFFAGHDSGPLHVAGSFGVPSVMSSLPSVDHFVMVCVPSSAQ